MAITAVSDALAKLKLNDAVDPFHDLVIELSWMKCFLLVHDDAGHPPPPLQGPMKKIADVWSPIIERLALRALYHPSYCVADDDDGLSLKLSQLRERIQPFLSVSHAGTFFERPRTPPTEVKVEAKPKKPIKVAAWGGPGGEKWRFHFDGILKQITVVNGEIIDSLAFTTLQPDGSLTMLKVGGNGGFETHEVKMDGAVEKLRGIKGTYGFFGSDVVIIRSISFRTNLKTYGPYGKKEGVKFKYEVEDDNGGDFVGFHGRAGQFVDAFGVYLQP